MYNVVVFFGVVYCEMVLVVVVEVFGEVVEVCDIIFE